MKHGRVRIWSDMGPYKSTKLHCLLTNPYPKGGDPYGGHNKGTSSLQGRLKPVLKPFSNSTVLVALIAKTTMDSQ